MIKTALQTEPPNGSKPNPDIPASELWLALQAIPRAHRIVDYPKINPATGEPVGQLAIRVLTQEEQFGCTRRAELFAQKHMGEKPKVDDLAQGYKDCYNNAAALELLCLACRDVKDLSHPVFPRPQQMMALLTNDEIAVLFRLYMQVQADLGPIIAHMGEQEREAWIVRLMEGGDVFPLGRLSSDEHDRLTMWAVSEVVRLRKAAQTLLTDLTSAGLQPSAYYATLGLSLDPEPTSDPDEVPTVRDENAEE